MKKARKPKKIAYALIDRFDDAGRRLYAVLDELVETFHEELKDARIALAWNLTWSPDVDGHCTLGKCKKASDLDRELAAFDFVIMLQRKFFEDPRVTDLQKRALLDHELHHAAIQHDADGEPVIDQRGRIVYRMRKHDLEEFSTIAERYGCWKRDLEAFAAAIDRSRAKSRNWTGYTQVRERLIAAGANIPLDTVIGWSEEQRREADVWARVRLELQRAGIDEAIDTVMPAHVAEAIGGRTSEPLPFEARA